MHARAHNGHAGVQERRSTGGQDAAAALSICDERLSGRKFRREAHQIENTRTLHSQKVLAENTNKQSTRTCTRTNILNVRVACPQSQEKGISCALIIASRHSRDQTRNAYELLMRQCTRPRRSHVTQHPQAITIRVYRPSRPPQLNAAKEREEREERGEKRSGRRAVLLPAGHCIEE